MEALTADTGRDNRDRQRARDDVSVDFELGSRHHLAANMNGTDSGWYGDKASSEVVTPESMREVLRNKATCSFTFLLGVITALFSRGLVVGLL